MRHIFRFRMSGKQYLCIYKKLTILETTQAIVGLCGSGTYSSRENMQISLSLTEKIYGGTTEQIKPFLDQLKDNQALAVFHKGISGYVHCLSDDIAFFSRVGALQEEKYNCLSVFLEDSQKCTAFIYVDGEWKKFSITCICGSDISFGFMDSDDVLPEQSLRTAQAFGKATTALLGKLAIGVVGVSGTGSIVAEQLFRLGVKELVLVDDDIIETKNLNRIVNSTMMDAMARINKAEMFTRAIENSGLPTRAAARQTVVGNPATIRALSQCDILFGCMDSIDGRYQLNRLAVYYSIPYFDLGVKLVADGQGGIDEISGAVHYMQPDGSSLLSRGVYTQDDLLSASLKRNNPEEYRKRLEEKYITGAKESSPAVISINMQVASMAINDMLARLHPYREDSNNTIETIRIDLTGLRFRLSPCSEPCSVLAIHVGQGDRNPILDMPALSEVDI